MRLVERLLKCRVASSGAVARAEFAGNLTDNSKRLTLTVIDMLELRRKLDDGLLVEDAMIGKMRKLTWKAGAGAIEFQFRAARNRTCSRRLSAVTHCFNNRIFLSERVVAKLLTADTFSCMCLSSSKESFAVSFIFKRGSYMNTTHRISFWTLTAFALVLCARTASGEDLTGNYKASGKGKYYSLIQGKPSTDGGPFTATMTQNGNALTVHLLFGVGFNYTLTGSVGNDTFIVTGKSDTTDELVVLSGHISGTGSKIKIKASAFFYVSDPQSSGDQHVEEVAYTFSKS